MYHLLQMAMWLLVAYWLFNMFVWFVMQLFFLHLSIKRDERRKEAERALR